MLENTEIFHKVSKKSRWNIIKSFECEKNNALK